MIKEIINKDLNKAIIIFNNLPYELMLKFNIAAAISNIKIINFFDLNKSIMYYLNYIKKIESNNNIEIIKIKKNNITVSIFENKTAKIIFKCFIDKNNIDIEKIELKDNRIN